MILQGSGCSGVGWACVKFDDAGNRVASQIDLIKRLAFPAFDHDGPEYLLPSCYPTAAHAAAQRGTTKKNRR
jgi:hypothetical protein